MWLATNCRWKKIDTLKALEAEMQRDAYFKPRHFRKVDQAIAHLQSRGIKFTDS